MATVNAKLHLIKVGDVLYNVSNTYGGLIPETETTEEKYEQDNIALDNILHMKYAAWTMNLVISEINQMNFQKFMSESITYLNDLSGRIFRNYKEVSFINKDQYMKDILSRDPGHYTVDEIVGIEKFIPFLSKTVFEFLHGNEELLKTRTFDVFQEYLNNSLQPKTVDLDITQFETLEIVPTLYDIFEEIEKYGFYRHTDDDTFIYQLDYSILLEIFIDKEIPTCVERLKEGEQFQPLNIDAKIQLFDTWILDFVKETFPIEPLHYEDFNDYHKEVTNFRNSVEEIDSLMNAYATLREELEKE